MLTIDEFKNRKNDGYKYKMRRGFPNPDEITYVRILTTSESSTNSSICLHDLFWALSWFMQNNNPNVFGMNLDFESIIKLETKNFCERMDKHYMKLDGYIYTWNINFVVFQKKIIGDFHSAIM